MQNCPVRTDSESAEEGDLIGEVKRTGGAQQWEVWLPAPQSRAPRPAFTRPPPSESHTPCRVPSPGQVCKLLPGTGLQGPASIPALSLPSRHGSLSDSPTHAGPRGNKTSRYPRCQSPLGTPSPPAALGRSHQIHSSHVGPALPCPARLPVSESRAPRDNTPVPAAGFCRPAGRRSPGEKVTGDSQPPAGDPQGPRDKGTCGR